MFADSSVFNMYYYKEQELWNEINIWKFVDQKYLGHIDTFLFININYHFSSFKQNCDYIGLSPHHLYVRNELWKLFCSLELSLFQSNIWKQVSHDQDELIILSLSAGFIH